MGEKPPLKIGNGTLQSSLSIVCHGNGASDLISEAKPRKLHGHGSVAESRELGGDASPINRNADDPSLGLQHLLHDHVDVVILHAQAQPLKVGLLASIAGDAPALDVVIAEGNKLRFHLIEAFGPFEGRLYQNVRVSVSRASGNSQNLHLHRHDLQMLWWEEGPLGAPRLICRQAAESPWSIAHRSFCK